MSARRRRATGWDLGLLDRSAARRRIAAVIRAIETHTGRPERRPLCDPLDELILTILSQNTNDRLRDRAFAALRERFPTWDDVIAGPTSAVAAAIKIGGLSNVKSGRIQTVLRTIRAQPHGFDLTYLRDLPTEEARAALSHFTGVGAKTVACVLVFGCGHDVFPVDTHILRLSKRLGLIPENLPLDRAHEFWGEACPAGEAYDLHLMLIRHGRTVCHARTPDCGQCPLTRNCAFYTTARG